MHRTWSHGPSTRSTLTHECGIRVFPAGRGLACLRRGLTPPQLAAPAALSRRPPQATKCEPGQVPGVTRPHRTHEVSDGSSQLAGQDACGHGHTTHLTADVSAALGEPQEPIYDRLHSNGATSWSNAPSESSSRHISPCRTAGELKSTDAAAPGLLSLELPCSGSTGSTHPNKKAAEHPAADWATCLDGGGATGPLTSTPAVAATSAAGLAPLPPPTATAAAVAGFSALAASPNRPEGGANHLSPAARSTAGAEADGRSSGVLGQWVCEASPSTPPVIRPPSAAREQQKQLCQRMKAAASPSELCDMISEHGHTFDAISVTTATVQAARLWQRAVRAHQDGSSSSSSSVGATSSSGRDLPSSRSSGRDLPTSSSCSSSSSDGSAVAVRTALLRHLRPLLLSKLGLMDDVGLVNLLHKLAVMGAKDEALLVYELVQAVTPRVQGLGPKLPSQLLWACVVLGHPPDPPLMAALLTRAAATMTSLKGVDCAQWAWSLAKLQFRPPEPWLAAFVHRVQQLLPTMDPHALCSCCWGLATLCPEQLLGDFTEALLSRSQRLFPEFEPQGFAVLACCLQGLELRPSQGWQLGFLQSSYKALPECSSHNLATLGFFVSSWQVVRQQQWGEWQGQEQQQQRPGQGQEQWEEQQGQQQQVRQQIEEAELQQLEREHWSACWYQQWLACCQRHLESFTPQGLYLISRSLVCLHHHQPQLPPPTAPWQHLFLAQATAQGARAHPASCVAVVKLLDAWQGGRALRAVLAAEVWAEGAGAWAEAAVPGGQQPAAAMAVTAAGGGLEVAPYLSACLHSFLMGSGSYSPRQLALLAVALAHLGVRPSPRVLQALLGGMQQQLRQAFTSDIAVLCACLAHWGHRLNHSQLSSFLAAFASYSHVCSPTCLTNMAWALTKMRLRPGGAFATAFCASCLRLQPAMSAKQQAVVLWAAEEGQWQVGHSWVEKMAAGQALAAQREQQRLVARAASAGGAGTSQQQQHHQQGRKADGSSLQALRNEPELLQQQEAIVREQAVVWLEQHEQQQQQQHEVVPSLQCPGQRLLPSACWRGAGAAVGGASAAGGVGCQGPPPVHTVSLHREGGTQRVHPEASSKGPGGFRWCAPAADPGLVPIAGHRPSDVEGASVAACRTAAVRAAAEGMGGLPVPLQVEVDVAAARSRLGAQGVPPAALQRRVQGSVVGSRRLAAPPLPGLKLLGMCYCWDGQGLWLYHSGFAVGDAIGLVASTLQGLRFGRGLHASLLCGLACVYALRSLRVVLGSLDLLQHCWSRQ